MSALTLFPRMKERGLTLVELLIALALGLVVVLVVGQIYLSGRQSYRTQTGFGGMQENGRFALFFLQRDIRMAGFPRDIGPGGALSGSLSGFNPTLTTDGGTGGSDQIEVQYNSFGTVPASLDSVPADLQAQVTDNNTFANSGRDCLGNPAGATVINRYWVANGDLMCEGNGDVGTPRPIISGVESMQILYGVDTDADLAPNVYRRADLVTAAEWPAVVAVRVGLLLNSQEPVYESPDTTWYAVLDAAPVQATDITATPLDERRFARRVFVTTIMIRNRTDV
jgi:type IV pilus assembly protein PilW